MIDFSCFKGFLKKLVQSTKSLWKLLVPILKGFRKAGIVFIKFPAVFENQLKWVYVAFGAAFGNCFVTEVVAFSKIRRNQ
jgi:hypothetical protein